MKNREANRLIKEKEALIKSFLAGNADNFLERLTASLDAYFVSVFEKSAVATRMALEGHRFAIIALGGYGRKEQCIHSDIDLLILFDQTVPNDVETFVQELLYPLWDDRFEVGYAVRRIDECLKMSFERFDILTTILDARFICGTLSVYSAFMEKFRQQLAGKHLKAAMTYLYETGQKRLADYGDSTYLVAPNLKSGFGGLRDYHTLLWYAKIKSNIKTRRDLEYYGFLSHLEYTTLETALAYIWDIRNRLHYISKRKNDTLHFERQPEVASLLDHTNTAGHTEVEAFLGKLHEHMEFLKQIFQITYEDIDASRRTQKDAPTTKPAGINGLIIKKRRLQFANTVVILQDPALLLKIFFESGRTRIPLSIEARRVVFEFRHLVDENLRKDPACVTLFKRILGLSYWEFNVLNVMLSTGILQRFIPEFTPLVDKIQYSQYHLFPVDKHSIRCVQIINSFKTPDTTRMGSMYAGVYKKLKNKSVLLVAGLLHDIGKSDPAREHSKQGAAIAGPIIDRLGFRATEKEAILFLIANHLLLAKTATRRDIYDEETAVRIAGKVGKIGLLRMLFLITVADAQATGPKAWNDWTEQLIKDLFLRIMGILRTGELVSKKSQRRIEAKKKEVRAQLKESRCKAEIDQQLSAMSRRYLLHVSAQNIVAHIHLHENLGDREFIWQITEDKASDMRTVSICGKNTPGFYSKVAGVFFQNTIDIVGSQAYSLASSHILDVFNVRPPKDRIFETEKWKKAHRDLTLALEDDHYLDRILDKIPSKITIPTGKRPEPNQVRIDNDTSNFFTIIEVLTYDFPGLLFAVTNTLYRNGLTVEVAMVATEVDQVIDIFYVKDLYQDRKIESTEQLKHIKSSIINCLPKVASKEVLNEKNRSHYQTL
ncbi:MAG: [protein-PII] uridylyltransferase [Desulfobacterales bacterium]|nr:MAG: [protein-PII] uridylyltransferase [Desulfobacterales bacterium]